MAGKEVVEVVVIGGGVKGTVRLRLVVDAPIDSAGQLEELRGALGLYGVSTGVGDNVLMCDGSAVALAASPAAAGLRDGDVLRVTAALPQSETGEAEAVDGDVSSGEAEWGSPVLTLADVPEAKFKKAKDAVKEKAKDAKEKKEKKGKEDKKEKKEKKEKEEKKEKKGKKEKKDKEDKNADDAAEASPKNTNGIKEDKKEKRDKDKKEKKDKKDKEDKKEKKEKKVRISEAVEEQDEPPAAEADVMEAPPSSSLDRAAREPDRPGSEEALPEAGAKPSAVSVFDNPSFQAKKVPPGDWVAFSHGGGDIEEESLAQSVSGIEPLPDAPPATASPNRWATLKQKLGKKEKKARRNSILQDSTTELCSTMPQALATTEPADPPPRVEGSGSQLSESVLAESQVKDKNRWAQLKEKLKREKAAAPHRGSEDSQSSEEGSVATVSADAVSAESAEDGVDAMDATPRSERSTSKVSAWKKLKRKLKRKDGKLKDGDKDDTPPPTQTSTPHSSQELSHSAALVEAAAARAPSPSSDSSSGSSSFAGAFMDQYQRPGAAKQQRQRQRSRQEAQAPPQPTSPASSLGRGGKKAKVKKRVQFPTDILTDATDTDHGSGRGGFSSDGGRRRGVPSSGDERGTPRSRQHRTWGGEAGSPLTYATPPAPAKGRLSAYDPDNPPPPPPVAYAVRLMKRGEDARYEGRQTRDGVFIREVARGGAFHRAGVRAGQIVSIDGLAVSSAEGLRAAHRSLFERNQLEYEIKVIPDLSIAPLSPYEDPHAPPVLDATPSEDFRIEPPTQDPRPALEPAPQPPPKQQAPRQPPPAPSAEAGRWCWIPERKAQSESQAATALGSMQAAMGAAPMALPYSADRWQWVGEQQLAAAPGAEGGGRIPDWREQLRARLNKSKGPDDAAALSAAAGSQGILTTPAPSDLLAVAEAEGGYTDSSDGSHTAGPTRKRRTGPVERTPTTHMDGYITRAADSPSHDTVNHAVGIQLDHVPGFRIGDEVEAVPGVRHQALQGKRGVVTGCEMRDGVLHVVAKFPPPHYQQAVLATDLRNWADVRIVDGSARNFSRP